MLVTHLTAVVFLHHRPDDGWTTSRNEGANIPFEQAEVCLEVFFFFSPDDNMFVISLARNRNDGKIFIRQTVCYGPILKYGRVFFTQNIVYPEIFCY